MRNLFLIIIGFSTVQNLQGQSASSYYNKGDSLHKIKDFNGAALAYGDGIRLEGNAVGMGRYWSCACYWSLASNPDSAFAYLKYLEYSDKVTIDNAIEIERDNDLKPLRSDHRWQPSIDAILTNAIKTLSEALRAGKRTNPSTDKYDLARAWGAAKNADSTLFYLNSVIHTDTNRFVAFNILSAESRFSFLHADPRWISLLSEVEKNYPPFTCDHRKDRPRIPMKLAIDPSSKFLRADDKGSYIDNVDKVSAYLQTGSNLMLSGFEPLSDARNWTDASSRYIAIDLQQPIIKSGSINLGIIKDHFVVFHFFYKIDTALDLDFIYNFNEIPIGTTIESPRADIEFFINKKLHLLKFGYWSLGDCGEWYARGGKVNGLGTTPVKITRHNKTSYTIEAPTGSIGRLWDIDNRTKPIDKGLYKSGFKINIETQ